MPCDARRTGKYCRGSAPQIGATACGSELAQVLLVVTRGAAPVVAVRGEPAVLSPLTLSGHGHERGKRISGANVLVLRLLVQPFRAALSEWHPERSTLLRARLWCATVTARVSTANRIDLFGDGSKVGGASDWPKSRGDSSEVVALVQIVRGVRRGCPILERRVLVGKHALVLGALVAKVDRLAPVTRAAGGLALRQVQRKELVVVADEASVGHYAVVMVALGAVCNRIPLQEKSLTTAELSAVDAAVAAVSLKADEDVMS